MEKGTRPRTISECNQSRVQGEKKEAKRKTDWEQTEGHIQPGYVRRYGCRQWEKKD